MQINTSATTDKEADRIRLIKLKAGKAIISLLPEWKQRNLLARAMELTDPNLVLTEVQQLELADIRASWAAVKAIRTASDNAEIAGTLASSFNP
jgi:hypothetical protein